ncbi:hypothetical protein [Saccharothrix variisporea]|uniref:PPE family protein n=1 Tax=Saccharothrix variisporea TaxID=543527 RepID=A0A495XF63_9PSEU|nr:hypothetical protein [Saccharothrix variisporea]RKT72647.1 hypothetical protein DFJ66_5969 [Saccharothrix variisporea]
MAVPYNALPIEAHVAMITAEQANVPVLVDAARMWTEVRTWIESARVELHTRAQDLAPSWTDQAGRELEEKFQRSDAELKMWGERIDASRVSETLTTLAAAIPETMQTVSALYEGYLAAISNPFTAGLAVAFQQAAGTRMTALGGQFDMSMLTVCSAAGIKSPGDVLPELPTVSKDDVEAATAVLGAATSLQGLASSAAGAALPDVSLPSLPDLPGSDLSLAGVTTAPAPPSLPTGGGVPGTGGAPTLSGGPLPVLPTTSATGLPLARPAGKRPEPTTNTVKAGGTTGTTPTMPPMTPPHGAQRNGTLRPSTSDSRTGRSRTTRRGTEPTDGVPETLRGRSGDTPSPAAPRYAGQPLDEELWQFIRDRASR